MAESARPKRPRPLTTQDVGEIFAVHRATVAQWADQGKLPAFKTPGGDWRFRQEDVDRFYAESFGPPVETPAAS